MSATPALLVLSWIAIIVLYFGLAAVLREVRMLSQHMAAHAADAAAPSDLQLPPSFVERVTENGQERLVLAADTGCPLCRYTVSVLAQVVTPDRRPVLLTYEPPERWSSLPETVELVHDRAAWASLAHLSPPVLLTIGADGTVRSLHLPTTEGDVAAALAHSASATERSS